MCNGSKKIALVAACTALAGLGAWQTASAATITINGGTSEVVDGWNITPQSGVTLTVTPATASTPLVIDKTADFTAPNQGFLVSFQPVSTTTDVIDFNSESIQNNSGTTWDGFQFLLSSSATFPSVSSTFAPPAGFFTTVSLNAAGNNLTYGGGSQASGTTSSWGSGTIDYDNNGNPTAESPDNLIIDAAGTGFDLKEIPDPASGPPNAIPLPSAAWQSFMVLSGLALIGVARKRLRTV
jgi:hypothetical protein